MEFKFAKILDETGAETLFGNSLKVFKAFNVTDEDTGVKITIMELQLADNSLKGWLDNKMKPEEIISEEEMTTVC